MSFLDGQLANALAAGFNGKLLKATIIKETVTGRDPSNGDAITTPTNFAAQGFQEDYNAIIRLASGIPQTDVKITLIAGLCKAVPAIGDRIMIRGGLFQVRQFRTDPAQAVYECQSFAVSS